MSDQEITDLYNRAVVRLRLMMETQGKTLDEALSEIRTSCGLGLCQMQDIEKIARERYSA